MSGIVSCSTPSRICLFGEHQDYLGLEVIASAINLRFFARGSLRRDSLIKIKIRDESAGELNAENGRELFENYTIDLAKPIVYENRRDYLKSTVSVLRREGLPMPAGADIVMTSDIPIGKGMCSSTTMVTVLTKLLMELYGHPDAKDPMKVALLAHQAEVREFNEPGGMMDHYTSALGGLLHIDFRTGRAEPERLETKIPGCFVLFDSLQRKDTIGVLSRSKYPTLEALKKLEPFGIKSVRDFYEDPSGESLLPNLDGELRRKLEANIRNYRIQRRALALLRSPGFDEEEFGELLSEHQRNLSEGLRISTPVIDGILQTARQNGALGGKFNGTGGGGCCFAYCRREDAGTVLRAVEEKGYPGKILLPDGGVRVEE